MGYATVLSGAFGEIKKSADRVAYITKWKIDKESDIARYQSSRLKGWKRAKPGGRGWTGNLDFELEADGTFSIDDGMFIADVEFHADDSGSNKYTGDVVIGVVTVEVDVATGDVVGGSASFVGDGTLTPAGACAVDELLSSS